MLKKTVNFGVMKSKFHVKVERGVITVPFSSLKLDISILLHMVDTSLWCGGLTSSDGEVYRLRALHTQLGASCEVQLTSNTADIETRFNVVPHAQLFKTLNKSGLAYLTN